MFFAYSLLMKETPLSHLIVYTLQEKENDVKLYCYSCPLCCFVKASGRVAEKGLASMKDCMVKFGRHFNFKHGKIVQGTAKSFPNIDSDMFAIASI